MASYSRNVNLRPSSLKSKARRNSSSGDDHISGRVRVALRLRPQNAEESVTDADFPDCVELQPELKRLKLRKNSWDSDTYEFDEVLIEFASQKRVYEVVAKPVVEERCLDIPLSLNKQPPRQSCQQVEGEVSQVATQV